MREKERGLKRWKEVKRVPEQGSPKGGSNVSTCLSATLDNQHSKQMKTHAYPDRAEWEQEEQRENGETEERWRFVLCLALAKVNWFSTSTPSLSFFWSGWRVRLCLGLSARLLVAALPVSLLPQLCHVLALWTAVNTHTYGTHTHIHMQAAVVITAFLTFFSPSGQSLLVLSLLFICQHERIFKVTHSLCAAHAINARAALAWKLATPTTLPIAVNKVKSIVKSRHFISPFSHNEPWHFTHY